MPTIPTSFSRFDFLFLALTILATLLFRAQFIGDRGLAGDEKYSLSTSQFISPQGGNLRESLGDPTRTYFTPQEVWRNKSFHDFQEAIARRENGSGSLYFLTLHHWSSIFGTRDTALRFPSLLFNVLLLPLAFLFSRRHFAYSKYTPYLVVVLAAVSPFYFHYSIAARNYALTFTLILAATYFFLNLLKETPTRWWLSGNFWAFGLLMALFVFGHHSALAVLPLFVLITFMSRKWQHLFPVVVAMLLPIACMGVWSMSYGGRFSYEFIQTSNEQYIEVAKNGSEAMVKFSTPRNIIWQFTQVFTYLYWPASGVFDHLMGLKNTALCLASALLLSLAWLLPAIRRFRWYLVAVAILGPLAFYSMKPHLFTLVAVGLSVLAVGIKLYLENFRQTAWQVVVIMGLVSMLLMMVYAWRDGVTIRINARYAGYGYIFTLMLLAYTLEYMAQKIAPKWSVIIFVMATLAFIIIPENQRIIRDDIPQYYQYVKGNRLANPYTTLADKIVATFQPGDTVIYSSRPMKVMKGNAAGPDRDREDALFTNLYLPKNATYPQRFDFDEPDSVFIWKKQSGRKEFLMDLSDKRY